MGSKATTPPSSTAKRSSEMVPRMMGRERMKRIPAPNRSHMVPVAAAALRACRVTTRDSSTVPSAKHTKHKA